MMMFMVMIVVMFMGVIMIFIVVMMFMGVGMILIVDPARAEEVEAALAEAGEKTYRVGRIVSGTGEVQYTGEGNLYGYQG